MKVNQVLSTLKGTLFLLAFTIALMLSGCSQKSDVAKYTNPESNQFFKTWMLLGPIYVADTNITPEEQIQKKAFDQDEINPLTITSLHALSPLIIDEKSYSWELQTSESDIMDLNAVFNNKNYAYAYAYAELDMKESKAMLCGLGSDDAVKVWLNGKEVHKNFVGRALSKDDDLIELNFKQGSNQLLLKIQNFEYGWEFCFRPIGVEMVSELVCSYAGKGDLDNINKLLKYKPDLNYKAKNGLTAWQNAKISGRDEVVDILTKNGAREDPNFPDLKSYVDNYIQSNLKENTPGFAVLIAQNGEVLFKKGYGFADVENKIKVDTKTKFRIGSITKQFIATGILKLQEEGKLTVQDKLSKYIPEFPRGDEVSIHHLLTHTSGIVSFTGRPGFIDSVANKVEAQTLMDSIMTWDFTFNPGDEMMYNNSGYFILGQIIEIVSGKWYGDYLKDEIFTPLKMNNTGVYINETPPEHEAKGYTLENDKYVLALNWNMSWAGGAGALYSTAEDLFLWNEAVFNGNVLSDESLKAAHTPVKLNNGEVAKNMLYGYGWGIGELREKKEIMHSGGLHGFISNLSRITDENLTVVTLTNTSPTMEGLNPQEVSNTFSEYALWKKLAPQKSYAAVAVDTNKLKDYVGRYDYGNSMVMVISLEENKLFAQLSGQPKFELFANKEDEFFWKVVVANITFIRNDSGIVTHGIHFQGGSELKVPKIPDLVTLVIDKAEIEPYLGKYKFQEGFFITLSINDQNRVFAQGTNQPKFEIFKTAKNTYQAKDVMGIIKLLPLSGKTQIEFEQNSTKTVMDKIE